MYSHARLQTKTDPIRIFVAYAHQDQTFRDLLEHHLSFLKRSGDLEIWHGRKIGPGEEWQGRILEHLDLSDLILLLVSASFASSDYCWDVEMKRALERGARGEAIVIPILVHPVAGWKESPLGSLQALPSNGTPVTEWRNRDAAFRDIAESIRGLLRDPGTVLRQVPAYWTLHVEDSLAEFPDERIADIQTRFRDLTGDTTTQCIGCSQDSTYLTFQSTPQAFAAVSNLHQRGVLEERLGLKVLSLEKDLGASLRLETRTIEADMHAPIAPLPSIFYSESSHGFPPLIGGMVFPPENPLTPGFILLSDATGKPYSAEEQVELQGRLGRYLNTFLVISGNHINVSLSPYEQDCGLPELLRHTELGRDLLSQDVVLKHYTSVLLHPAQEPGKAFWDEVSDIYPEQAESFLRVWIVPDKVVVKEEGSENSVKIQTLRLRACCEYDYRMVKASPQSKEIQVTTDLFKKHILPRIQQEVDLGPRFGVLRQIFSVCIMAEWIRQSGLGDLLKKAGFLDSNDPARYRLNTVLDDIFEMKKHYLQIFQQGVWQYTRSSYDLEKNVAVKRLYVSGGLRLL